MPGEGRQKGSGNKNKKFLLNKLQDMYGDDFHPIMKMAKNCILIQGQADKLIEQVTDDSVGQDDKPKADDVNKMLVMANTEWYRIAEYTEPKLKAIEIDLSDEMRGLVFQMQYGPKKDKDNPNDGD